MDDPFQLFKTSPYNTIITNQKLLEDLQEIYDIQAFNIGFKAKHTRTKTKRSTKFIPFSTPSGFIPTKDSIDNLVDRTNIALSFLTAAAMYMDTTEHVEDMVANANLLYMISGHIYSATKLLDSVRQDMKSGSSTIFSIQSHLPQNIADYLTANPQAYQGDNSSSNTSSYTGKMGSKTSYIHFR
jgi:hypothetical protein